LHIAENFLLGFLLVSTFFLQYSLFVVFFFEASQSQSTLFFSSFKSISNILLLLSVQDIERALDGLMLGERDEVLEGVHCPNPTRPHVSLHIADNVFILPFTPTFILQYFLRFDFFFEASQAQSPSVLMFPFKSISNILFSLSVQDTERNLG